MQTSLEAPKRFDLGTEADADPARPEADIELLDLQACRGIVGGTKPVHAATIYRLIAAGRLPAPVKMGGSARWKKRPFVDAVRAMIEGRG
jgi:predicted DNA-binding transcriptional regulator AlpA